MVGGHEPLGRKGEDMKVSWVLPEEEGDMADAMERITGFPYMTTSNHTMYGTGMYTVVISTHPMTVDQATKFIKAVDGGFEMGEDTSGEFAFYEFDSVEDMERKIDKWMDE
jgi:hypothetical protein